MSTKPPRRFPTLRALTSTAIRVYVLTSFMVAMLGVLSAKLWHEQITNSKKWSDRVRKSSSVTVRIPAVRGEIRDRNGITLVANRSSYSVDFYLPQMVEGFKELNDGKAPLVNFRTTRDGMLADVKVPDIVGTEAARRSGWIEFGEPNRDVTRTFAPRLRSFQPEPGLLLLFPSYFYHKTLPFDAPEQRISISFDVVPERPSGRVEPREQQPEHGAHQR